MNDSYKLKDREIILFTGKRYYSRDGKKCGKTPDEVATTQNYVIAETGQFLVYGFEISATDDPGILAFTPVVIGSRSVNKLPLTIKVAGSRGFLPQGKTIYFNKDEFNLPGYKYQSSIARGLTNYLDSTPYNNGEHFWTNWRPACDEYTCDISLTIKSSKPGGKFSQETMELLQTAGFPKVFSTSAEKDKELDSLDALCQYYKQQRTQKCSKAIADKVSSTFATLHNEVKLYNNKIMFAIDPVKTPIGTTQPRIMGEINKKTITYWFQNNSETPGKLHKPHIYVPKAMRSKFIKVLSQFEATKNFADFLDTQIVSLFSYDPGYKKATTSGTPIFEFVKYLLKHPKEARYLENLTRLSPSSVFVPVNQIQNCCRDDHRGVCFYLNEYNKTFIHFDQWDLPHQLGLNKGQIRNMMNWKFLHPKWNFQDIFCAVRVWATQLLPIGETMWVGSGFEHRGWWGHNTLTPIVKQYGDLPISNLTDSDIKLLLDALEVGANPHEYMYQLFPTVVDTIYCSCPFIETARPEDLVTVAKKWTVWQTNHSTEDNHTYKRYYKDYLNMRKMVPDPIAYPLLPPTLEQLVQLHDALAQQYDPEVVGRQHALAQYKSATKRMAQQMYYEDSKYIIRLCENPIIELPLEGAQLHHCVGSYVATVLARGSFIFFLRRKDSKNTPFITINLDASLTSVIQIHGIDNWWLGNWPEAIIPVQEWLKQHRIMCSERILKSTAKGYRDEHTAPLATIPPDYNKISA